MTETRSFIIWVYALELAPRSTVHCYGPNGE